MIKLLLMRKEMRERETIKNLTSYCFVEGFTKLMGIGFMRDIIFPFMKIDSLIYSKILVKLK